jgi:methylated-DNA-[protein]-cysteine S-methyltransferase
MKNPRAVRAVGSALRRNPFAPVVPCHRVVATNLSLGGFNGKKDGPELAKKVSLLEKEGVVFDHKGKICESCLFFPPSHDAKAQSPIV